MKRIIPVCLWIGLLIFGTSCSSLHNSVEGTASGNKGTNPYATYSLNGDYGNISQESPDDLTFWEEISTVRGFQKSFKEEPICTDCQVRLEVLNKDEIRFVLLQAGKEMDEIQYKGSFSNNSFLLKKQMNFGGAVPLLWGLGKNKVRVAITQEGSLRLIRDSVGYAMLTIVPFYYNSGSIWKTTYPRVQ